MNRFPLIVVAVALFIGLGNLSAGPQQIESKDYKTVPPPAPELCKWTGFYIGIHGGYGWGENSFLEMDELDPAYNWDQNGFFGGGQIGFNLQPWSFLVLGVEGTFAGTDWSDSAEINPNNELSRAHVDTNWLATVGGRVGFTFWRNKVLAFAKGGAAFTRFNYHSGEVNGNERFNAEDDQTVPLLGFGVEYAVTCHWSVKVEYNHLFLDSQNVTGIETEGNSRNSRTFRTDPDMDTIQAGLNFRF